MYSGGLDTLVRTVIDWGFIGCSGGISMCFRFLKSKCLNIKLKCCVGDPDRYWNIGRKRYCALYLSSSCGGCITGVRMGGMWLYLSAWL